MATFVVRPSTTATEMTIMMGKQHTHDVIFYKYGNTASNDSIFKKLRWIMISSRKYVHRVRMLCINNFEVRGRNVSRLMAAIIRMPNLREFRYFRELQTTGQNTLLPSMLSVLRQRNLGIESLGIESAPRGSSEFYTSTDVFFISQIVQIPTVKYLSCFNRCIQRSELGLLDMKQVFLSSIELKLRKWNFIGRFVEFGIRLQRYDSQLTFFVTELFTKYNNHNPFQKVAYYWNNQTEINLGKHQRYMQASTSEHAL